MSTRVYMVHDLDLDQRVLVRASTASQAIRAVVTPRFAAAVATQDQLIRMAGAGEAIVDASKALANDDDAGA